MARKRQPPRRSGVLNIDKPPGWTSHDVVARVRRLTAERQVGHAGTLDPAASGVLPVAVGHATKVLPFVEDEDKVYVATVRFGVVSDTGDRDGRLIDRPPVDHLTAATIESSLARFRGQIAQIPPMHSAIKVGGRRLYDVARQGDEIDVPIRTVTIHDIELVAWHAPDAILRVVCSKGTYIRSLARDLGVAVGSGAMLANLVRTRSGRFTLDASIPLDALGDRLERYGWGWLASHPDSMLDRTGIVVLDTEGERSWFDGVPVCADASAGLVRVYDSRRAWVGIGEVDRERGVVQPKRVIQGTAG